METPEFQFEHEAGNVRNAIEQFGINYPVVQDNEMGTWNAYDNEYWPADYLIGPNGEVRYTAFGEGDYEKTETAIRALLAESGAQVGGMSHPSDVVVPSEEATPETYLGTARAQGWVIGPKSGTHDYGPPSTAPLALNDFSYSGTWKIDEQPAEAVSQAGVELQFLAKHVYLVLSSPGERPLQRPGAAGRQTDPRQVCGLGRPRRRRHGAPAAPVHLVSLPNDQQHRLALRFAPGVSAYAFTFG